MNDIRIGIDLGTCYSSVGYNDHHGIHFIQDPTAPQLTYSIPSSALLRPDNERFVFGELAESEKNAAPEGYRSEFKRDLGSSVPYRLRGRQISAVELTAKFLDFLVALTTTALDAVPASAVITVPAAYDQFRQSLIDEAARHAGLPEISLVAEPVAAVISAADRGQITGGATVLVYDLGGGTFDAAIVQLDDGEQTVLGANGLADFGGTDIDRLIEQDFARKAGDEFAEILAAQDTDDPKLLARARRISIAAEDFCRKIKHRLSSTDHVYDVLNLQFDYELSRRELEDMVRPHLYRTISTCQQLLTTTKLTPDQIDTVLLVGGTSRMPMVREILVKELGRPVRSAADPELAVCVGAAILARAWEEADRQVPDVADPPAPDVADPPAPDEADPPAPDEADGRAREEAELRDREARARSTGREGDPAGARDQFAALLPVREQVSGAEHPYTLAARHNLAFWTGQAGDAAAARDQFTALLPVRERVSGTEDAATLNVRSNLAFWTGQAGDAAAARDQLAALLPIRRQVSGAGHPETLMTRRELARWTGEAGDAAAARDQLAALLPVIKRTLGTEHPDTLTAQRQLDHWTSKVDGRAREEAELRDREARARSTGREGDPAGARDQFAALLPVREQVSGAEHPYTLAARHNLAFWTGQAGDAAAARDQFTALLPVRERVSGTEDAATLNVRSNLAFWTGQAGDAAAARDQLAALLPIRRQVSGAGHPETLITRRELARWTGEAGDAAAARDQLAALLPVIKRTLGTKHPDTLMTRRELARWTGEAGDAAAARDQLAALLPVIKRTLGTEHPDTLTAQRQLDHWTSKVDGRAREEAELRDREARARSTGREGDPAGARDQFAALLPVREQVSGAEHPYTLAARHNLAFWTGQAGDAAAARDQFTALLPVRERVSGTEDAATLNVRSNLAFWTGQAGDAAAARDQLAALLPIRRQVSGAGHPETLITRRELARWTGEAGDAAAARDQLAALLPVIKRTLGTEHPDTLTAQRQLDHWTSKINCSN